MNQFRRPCVGIYNIIFCVDVMWHASTVLQCLRSTLLLCIIKYQVYDSLPGDGAKTNQFLSWKESADK